MSAADAPTESFWTTWRRRLESPVATYYILIGATTALVVIGLVMVLSASSVTAFRNTGSSYTDFKKQAIYAGLGVIAFIVISRTPVAWLKRLALPAFAFAVLLQLAVFSPLGLNVKGNRNWLAFGGFSMQPSELGKLALVLVGALVLAKKREVIGQIGHVLIPFVPMVVLLLGLVLAGHDLGTGLVFMLICSAMLFVAGVRLRWFGAAAAVLAVAVLVMVQASDNRMGRIDAWLGTCTDIHSSNCYQKVHALYALSDGGWWGVGLGASREKWLWLPEAHNDFIFAIIGEELGLPGSLVVLGLYLAIAFAGYRIIVRSDSLFVRLASAGIITWIVGQALINIGSVTGLLPVIGIPLPLVSAGGSALITTMAGLAVLVSFARADPACRAALAARPSLVRRSAAVMPRPARKVNA